MTYDPRSGLKEVLEQADKQRKAHSDGYYGVPRGPISNIGEFHAHESGKQLRIGNPAGEPSYSGASYASDNKSRIGSLLCLSLIALAIYTYLNDDSTPDWEEPSDFSDFFESRRNEVTPSPEIAIPESSAPGRKFYNTSNIQPRDNMIPQYLNPALPSASIAQQQVTPSSLPAFTHAVTASALNIRVGAGTEFAVDGRLDRNDCVRAVGSAVNGWQQVAIETPSGVGQYYVSSDYLRPLGVGERCP